METDSYKPVNSDDDVDVNKRSEDAEEEPLHVNEDEEAKMSLTGNDQNATVQPSNAKIQFSNANNHDGLADDKKDPVITIQDFKTTEFSGMNKEELMKYVNDPFWIRLRWILFILFWIGWIAMIVGAIVIVVLAPRCAPPPERQWFQKGAIYQVYPRSFKDSNSDGNGDLQGIISKLDYLKDIGVTSILLNPIYKSNMVDGGYDITNYTGIDAMYGNMTDFDELMNAVKSKGLYLILDFVPNHSSIEHRWFDISSNPGHDQHDEYKEYYVWSDGDATGNEPNNWRNVYSGSAWTWNANRKKYYLHQFLPSQPDLNLRNPKVKEELKNILKFWLDKGVHGFRVDAVTHMFENADLKNEVKNEEWTGTDPNDHGYWDHSQTQYQPEMFELLAEWRTLLDEYSSDDEKRILMTESYEPVKKVASYYQYKNSTLVDIPMNMGFIDLKSDFKGTELKAVVEKYYKELGDTHWPNWQVGNHDADRVGSRLGGGMIDLMNMLTAFLNGTVITYYGEEIGMTNTPVALDQIVDGAAEYVGDLKNNEAKMKASRDPSRTPMQWEGSDGAGFSKSKNTWLPVNINKNRTNVKDELAADKSHLKLYKDLLKLRTESALLYGSVEFPIVDELVFSALRYYKGVPGYLLVMNVGNNGTTVDFSGKGKLPETGIVRVSSTNLVDGPLASKGDKVNLDSVKLDPKQGVVFTFIPNV